MKPVIDKARVAASFSKAAGSYDAVAELQQGVARITLECAKKIKPISNIIADIGCGTGLSTKLLSFELMPNSLTAVDIAEGMLQACAKRNLPNTHYVCADAEALPEFPNPFDLVFSNFALQWCPSIETAFKQIRSILNVSGIFAFSLPGLGSLTELKQAWAATDSSVHVNYFYSAAEIEQALQSAGFKRIQIQRVEKILFYPSALDLMHELKSLGAHNVHAGRSIALTGKRHFKMMLQAYEEFRNQENQLPATWQVLIGIAQR